MTSPIILALDADEISKAAQWINATRGSVDIYKIGLEFFLKFGAAGIAELRKNGDFEIFLDLKLHDIPNTVGNSVKSISHLHPKFLTVHASGGREMVKAATSADSAIAITAVTILTSLSDGDLVDLGFAHNAEVSAVQLAKLAVSAGARAIVCSPFEVTAIRAAVGDGIVLITPGVRPLGSEAGDQKRIMTPSEAISAGANYLVIGRPITGQPSPQAMTDAAAAILSSI
jgi:orotidine-5'-phosphate decarboxylase